MSKYKLLLASAVIVAASGVYLSRAQRREPAPGPREPELISLETRLLRLGEQYDLYFTLETAWADGQFRSWMEQYKVERSAEKGEAWEALEALRLSVPNFTYSFSRANPKVVHVMDARLAQRGGYALDEAVKSLDYAGTLVGLVNAIGERGAKVSSGGVMNTSDPRPRDYTTEVRVEARAVSVREALTDFIPLEGRYRILWISTTKLAPGEVSYVRHYGPAKRP